MLIVRSILLLSLILVSRAGAQVKAPYQIEVQEDQEKQGTKVEVILDDLTGRAPKKMTIVSASSAAVAKLEKTERRCENLCHDSEPETCHEVAIYSLPAPLPSAALAALAGEIKVSVSPLAEPIKQEFKIADWVNQEYQSDLVSPHLYDAINDGSVTKWRFDLTPKSNFLQLHRSSSLANTQRSEEVDMWPGGAKPSDCNLTEVAPFKILDCPFHGMRLLFLDKKLLVVSDSDYSERAAEPVAQLSINDSGYFLTKIGIKGQVVYVLLAVNASDAAILMRPRDYPQMC